MWWSKVKYQGQHMMFLSLILSIIRLTNSKTTHIDTCPTLTPPEHGYFFSDYCERKVGALCGIGCFPGYRHVDGDSLLECQQDGTWTGHPTKCEEIRCPALKINAQINQECSPQRNNTDFKFGTKCRSRCEIGYRLIGPNVRECLIIGIWSGYEQFCIVNTETTTYIMATTTSTEPSTTAAVQYHDFSNYVLPINNNNTELIFSPFPSSEFTIIFWFYLETGTNANLISLRGSNNNKIFEIVVRQDRLVYHHSTRNQTQPTFLKIPVSKWSHFVWTYSSKIKKSYLYTDGARQQSFDFGIINFNFENVSSLILFNQIFNGLITRLEIWKEMISEQQLLVSYRDCRKQTGDFFSWSKVPHQFINNPNQLKSSSFCSGCSEPASIYGGTYRVSDYEIGSSVEYECNYGHEMIGSNKAYCMVPSEWYPLPPVCKYNPCTTYCELCEKKTGVCLRQQIKSDYNECDPPCDDDEECIDGQCTWSNTGKKWKSTSNINICNPQCLPGTQCINGQCQPIFMPYCPVLCRLGQICVDGRCGCYKGLCDNGRACYEVCEVGERCFNWSCSCGVQGKCNKGEICELDVCMCGTQRGGCRSNEHCVNGRCICKTNFCDQCNNTCQSNEICLNGKCICKEQCEKAFCPFPCLHSGRCTGFYQCTCQQGWQGYRCERRQNMTLV